MVRSPAKRCAQVREFGCEPGIGVSLTRAVPQRQDFGFSVGKVLRVRRPARRHPPAASFSSANWRTVSSIEYRARSADRSATSNDLRTSESSRSSPRTRRVAESSDSTGTLEIKAACEHRTPFQQCLFRRLAGRTTTPPRGAVSGGVPARDVFPPAAGNVDRGGHGPRWRSSTPSAKRQIRSPAGFHRGGDRPLPLLRRSRGPPTEKSEATLTARSTKSLAAAEFTPVRTSSEGTRHTRSSSTPSPSRLVASIRTVEDWARIVSTRSPTVPRTCSQLSKISSRILPSSAAATESATLLPGCWVIPSTAAAASGTAAGSATAASSKTQFRQEIRPPDVRPTSMRAGSCRLHPTPVNVTSRCARTAGFDPSTVGLTADRDF